MPAIGAPQRADEVARVDQRVELLRLLERDHLGFHAEVARARADEPQAVELARRSPRASGRRSDAARTTAPTAASISRYRSIVYFCRREMLASPLKVCMPPAACQVEPGGELALLQQQHIGPADLRQVIEHAGADDAAADDDGSRGSLHECGSPDRALTVTSARGVRPKGRAAAASHSRKCRAVLAGVSEQHSGGQRGEDRRHLGHDGGGGVAGRKDLPGQDPGGSRARAPRAPSGPVRWSAAEAAGEVDRRRSSGAGALPQRDGQRRQPAGELSSSQRSGRTQSASVPRASAMRPCAGSVAAAGCRRSLARLVRASAQRCELDDVGEARCELPPRGPRRLAAGLQARTRTFSGSSM